MNNTRPAMRQFGNSPITLPAQPASLSTQLSLLVSQTIVRNWPIGGVLLDPVGTGYGPNLALDRDRRVGAAAVSQRIICEGLSPSRSLRKCLGFTRTDTTAAPGAGAARAR
jgi:hypothetical protein